MGNYDQWREVGSFRVFLELWEFPVGDAGPRGPSVVTRRFYYGPFLLRNLSRAVSQPHMRPFLVIETDSLD